MSQPDLMMPLTEALLDFRVKVPEGCSLVVALRTPSGQLVDLADLVAEDAGGVKVGQVAVGEREGDPEGEVVFRARRSG